MQGKKSNVIKDRCDFSNFLLEFFLVPNYSHIISTTAQKMPCLGRNNASAWL
jgi:hypothetical protein